MSFLSGIVKGIGKGLGFVGKVVGGLTGIKISKNGTTTVTPTAASYDGSALSGLLPGTGQSAPLDLNKWVTLPDIPISPSKNTSILMIVIAALLAFLLFRRPAAGR